LRRSVPPISTTNKSNHDDYNQPFLPGRIPLPHFQPDGLRHDEPDRRHRKRGYGTGFHLDDNRVGASVATGAVLDFAVKQSGTRTRLANEMYAAANAVYSLSSGTFPAPAQFQSSILAFGGSQTDASYAQFSTAIAGLYAAYYPKLTAGDSKTAADLLNAIAGGIEDATQAYVTTPAAPVSALTSSTASF
jgi:hypothetical protein